MFLMLQAAVCFFLCILFPQSLFWIMKNLILATCLLFLTYFSQAQEIDSVFKAEIASFTDSLVEHQIKKNIAGATVSVVKDGEIIHLQGYGLADVEQDIAVDPERHLFRIGSISKMFIWTSIMQLVEEGKVNLDDDITKYMDLEIPQTFAEPITIKHLMTHTPGFEDRIIGLFGRDASTIRPLSEILNIQLPERVYPSEVAAAYSNHGTGMAQYIVERISGMEFHDYVTQHILVPLEMEHTTFMQPVPEHMKEDLSRGYVYANDKFIAMDFEYVPMYGVGACSSTAEDMANFMITHLQLGTFKDQQILVRATAQMMQSPAFYNHPRVNPMRYGFMDVSQNGVTIIGHGGDTGWFHSLMALYPEENLGVFISFNSQSGGPAYMKFVEAFTDRFFPEKVAPIQPALDAKSLNQYAGFYMSNRYPHTTMAKVAKLAISSKLEVTKEGFLKSNFLGDEKHWIPVDDEIFRDRDSNEILVFTKNEAGNIANLYIGMLPIFMFEKAGGIDNPFYHLVILGLLVVFVLFTSIFWIIKYFVRRLKKRTRKEGGLTVGSKRISTLVTILWILFLAILITGIAMDPLALVYEVPVLVKISLIFPVLIALLLLIMVYNVVITWKNSDVRLINKLYLTTLFVVYAAGIWVLNYWNLLGFKY